MASNVPDLTTPELVVVMAPQQRRTDPLRDSDVAENVRSGEELTSVEKFLRRTAAQKKPIGGFLVGLGLWLTSAAVLYPKPWVLVAAALCGNAGSLLVGGGLAGLKSDEYDRVKNALLRQKGLM